MEHKELSKLFYMSSKTDRSAWLEEEARFRRSMPSSFDKGQLTFFTLGMMELIRIVQTNIADQLERSRESLEIAIGNTDNLAFEFNLNGKEVNVAFVMMQYELFGMHESASLDDISQGISLSKQMTRKHLAHLEDSDAAVETSKRPVVFAFSDKAKSSSGYRQQPVRAGRRSVPAYAVKQTEAKRTHAPSSKTSSVKQQLSMVTQQSPAGFPAGLCRFQAKATGAGRPTSSKR